MSQEQFVLPGDIIVTGDYQPEQNVILEGDRLMSTAIGFSEIKDDLVTVTPLTGLYTPKTDDLVVGKIVSHNALSWEVNINSYYPGILTAFDIFGKDYSASRDDLSLKLNTGDIILARIANVNSRDPLITITGENLGKIDSGELVKISPAKIPRLTEKNGSMIETIEGSTNATITVGQNGLIVVSCDETNGLLKALAAIRMVDEQAHLVNLTDKVKKMLESNGV
jgi:exosome complex component RRP4